MSTCAGNDASNGSEVHIPWILRFTDNGWIHRGWSGWVSSESRRGHATSGSRMVISVSEDGVNKLVAYRRDGDGHDGCGGWRERLTSDCCESSSLGMAMYLVVVEPGTMGCPARGMRRV
jgi:hypothetical protein